MLSNKWTFSLTFLVVLLIFGLAIYVPSAVADHGNFGVSISAAETMIDVSSDGGFQIASGRDRADRSLTASEVTLITLLIKTDRIVNLGDPDAGVIAADLVGRSADEVALVIQERAKQVFDDSDIIIDAYDAEGRSLGILPFKETEDAIILSHRDPNNPGREFLARVDETKLTNAYTALRGGGQSLEIHTLLFSIPKDVMEQADIDYVTKKRSPDGHPEHYNNAVGAFRVDLVDDDEGLAAYNTGLGTTAAGSGVPGVVAIQSLRERAGFIETGDFTVRVILTEEPTGGEGLTTAMIAVKNGSATRVDKGTTLRGGVPNIAGVAASAGTPPVAAIPPQEQRDSELTPAMVSYYFSDGTDANTGMVPADRTDGTGTDTDGTFNTDSIGIRFPQPTGRDNKFHQYFVTVTPDPGLTNADVVISVKQFSDKVIPVASDYVPLSDPEIVATTLSDVQARVRDSRVANEMLTVKATTVADTTSKVAVAGAAYETRKKVLDAAAGNVTELANKTYIPAGGFLVLVADAGKAGIQASDVKTKDKTGPELLYNTHALGLDFPADDLDNFFRNGGTLTLGYADIPAATGSGHADSKGATGDDATGYTAADSTAYAAGALIFNEIMWGLDGNDKTSQYIELHNPGTAAIGIDNKEWVISVGALPAGYAAIDTAGNNPASGFWEVPGTGGVTTVRPDFPTVSDLVSMSRVNGAPDGTAADSWAASIRSGAKDDNDIVGTSGAANISGRRIGTPGAANNYAVPAPKEPTTTTTTTTPVAPAAEADDIMISEVMVASNGGRLPQWVELANVSGAAVSLTGWSLEIENDSADTDVIGDTVIDLSGIEIGEDQVALVVSKEGRNSGVGDGEGDLRADRILDVQSTVSPDNARYSLISEMGFMLTLLPPRTAGSAIRAVGDSGGNLNKGWDIPTSEDGRSSLIRSDKDADMGTDAADWVLASGTDLSGAYRTTYYGSDEDMGTPGFDAGGALPVELSMFSAKRNDAGQVVITWETQSELNNAGFFIKRSQQKDGKFSVVNAVMVAGAGTTAEKQSYTYTDSSASPNIVYYYQIEDVSLDGNRQTLTRAHRLKGHIGAAGKLTTIWGELKEQE